MKIAAAVLIGFCSWTASAAFAQNWKAPPTPEAVPGEFIVMVQPGADSAARSTISQSDGAVLEPLPLIGGYLVRAPNVANISNWVDQLKARPGIQVVEPNWRLYVLDTNPNDTNYKKQWGLSKIAAPKAWSIKKESPAVVVAVIDTGIDYNHPDVQGNMWKNPKEIPGNGVDDDKNGYVDDVHGASFVATPATGNPFDDHSHGTHVAGIIGAVTNNGAGIAGTTWKTQLMAVKFLDANGFGDTAKAIKAIGYATQMGAHIMNNSWGGGGFSVALKTAIEQAQGKGIVFTAATGNDQRDTDATPQYPSSYDVSNIISVMATDTGDNRSVFSNWGKMSSHLAAPGSAILSTIPNKGYDSFSGTSMATPFVSGAAALLKAANPGWNAEQIKKRLMATVDGVAALKTLNASGGRLNLEKALK